MDFTEIDYMEYSTDLLAASNYIVNIDTPGVQNETKEFIERVVAGNGSIVSTSEIDTAIIHAKTNNYYNNIKGWYSSMFGFYNAGSNKVSKLFDLSQYRNDFYHTNSAMYPTWTSNQKNSKPGIIFDGVDDNLIKTNSATRSLFIVFSNSNPGANYSHPFGNGFHGGSGSSQWHTSSPAYSVTHYINGTSVAGPSVIETMNYTIMNFTLTSSAMVGQLGWGDGNSYAAFPGIICEFIILDCPVDTTMRQLIEAALNSRWGIY